MRFGVLLLVLRLISEEATRNKLVHDNTRETLEKETHELRRQIASAREKLAVQETHLEQAKARVLDLQTQLTQRENDWAGKLESALEKQTIQHEQHVRDRNNEYEESIQSLKAKV